MRKTHFVRRGAIQLLRIITLSLLASALLAASVAKQASADPQISSEFTRVAKALAKRISSDQLAKICDKKTGSNLEVCKAITNSASAAFEMAIEGKVDEQAVTAALVELASRLTQAAAADAARQLIETVLTDLNRQTAGACRIVTTQGGKVVDASPAEISENVSTCLIARVLRAESKTCDDLEKRIQSLAVMCKTPKGDAQEHYQALLVVTQLRRLLSGSMPSDFYGTVAKAVESYDKIFAGIDSPNDQSIFEGTELDTLLVSGPADDACKNLTATRKGVTDWKARRYAVFVGLSRALVTFAPLNEELLKEIPVDLPDPGCPADHPLAQATTKVKRFANTYRTDMTLVAALDPLVLPAFLGALLVDYARDHNATKLRKHLEDFALRVLARGIASRDTNGMRCVDKTCSELVASEPPKPSTTAPKDISNEELQAVFEDRFSPSSALRTCEYQAVASVLGRNFALGPLAICRKLALPGGYDILAEGGPFSALLGTTIGNVALPSGYGQWSAAQLVRVQSKVARLALAAQLDANVGYSNLLLVLRGLIGDLALEHGFGSIVGMLDEALRPLLEDRAFDFSRVVLAESARKLRPLVEKFLDKQVEPIKCADGKDASSIRCGVRILIGAVYDPLLEYVIIENPTDADRRRLATRAYATALELDPLSNTPLLFNVGLGATGLTRFDDDHSIHLTLLDKIGLAARWGDRNQGEAGLFVGGFLDAIIRTAADSPEETQYWLAGGTVGWRQFCSCMPFGAGVHLAAGLPFDLTKTRERVAFAGGVVLTVPADIAFGD